MSIRDGRYVAALLVAVALVWLWRGERWAPRTFEAGLEPPDVETTDSAETVEHGMDLALTAGSHGRMWSDRTTPLQD